MIAILGRPSAHAWRQLALFRWNRTVCPQSDAAAPFANSAAHRSGHRVRTGARSSGRNWSGARPQPSLRVRGLARGRQNHQARAFHSKDSLTDFDVEGPASLVRPEESSSGLSQHVPPGTLSRNTHQAESFTGRLPVPSGCRSASQAGGAKRLRPGRGRPRRPLELAVVRPDLPVASPAAPPPSPTVRRSPRSASNPGPGGWRLPRSPALPPSSPPSR